MPPAGFHDKPYAPGTLTKLRIFELFVQAWIPVFVSQPEPPFREIHIFDLFCGRGTDSMGTHGSPLRILNQLRSYHLRTPAGWSKVRILVHFSDSSKRAIQQLAEVLCDPQWSIPGVAVETSAVTFEEALAKHNAILANPHVAKLLVLDQFGVDAVTEPVFKQLISSPRTDFIFFLSSSTLHRFRDHPAIKIHIGKVEDSYEVHRAAFEWYQGFTPPTAFLGRFSIKKGSNIYGLIFGSQHPLGAHKFLEVAWRNDEIRGEANFDIERENIVPGEPLLPLDTFRPKKVQAFEAELEAAVRTGKLATEAEVVHFCIAAGMTCQHATPVLQKLKSERAIRCDFRTPNVRRLKEMRRIHLC